MDRYVIHYTLITDDEPRDHRSQTGRLRKVIESISAYSHKERKDPGTHNQLAD